MASSTTCTTGASSAATRPSGASTRSVALREAAYEPERVQFYRLVDIPFARELRQVSVHHPFPGLAVAASGGGDTQR